MIINAFVEHEIGQKGTGLQWLFCIAIELKEGAKAICTLIVFTTNYSERRLKTGQCEFNDIE